MEIIHKHPFLCYIISKKSYGGYIIKDLLVCPQGISMFDILKGVILMYTYKSEIIETSVKWFKDSANEQDTHKLDELINKKVSEGWEFVCHSYMANYGALRSAILVTFRREKE